MNRSGRFVAWLVGYYLILGSYYYYYYYYYYYQPVASEGALGFLPSAFLSCGSSSSPSSAIFLRPLLPVPLSTPFLHAAARESI
jgi:hypothetical protein